MYGRSKGGGALISYDFEYYLPLSIKEALQLFEDLHKDGKEPIYFSGGTEIITLGRLNTVTTGAVINIKHLRECQLFKIQQGNLVTGAANTLTTIEGVNLFPLLSKTVSEIADRTARIKLRLVVIFAVKFLSGSSSAFSLNRQSNGDCEQTGIKTVSIHDVFNQRLLLERGEFLVQVVTDQSYLHQPFVSIKKRRQWNTGYPLITVAALKVKGLIRVAVSGLTVSHFDQHKWRRN